MRSRPLARAARPPSTEVRPGPRDWVRSSRSGPGGRPSTPAPRLTCTRVVAAAGILSTRRAPRRGTKPGQGGVPAPHPIPLSGPRARLPGRAARPNRPSLLRSSRQPAAAARAAAELARRLLTWNLGLPSMPSPRRSQVGFPRDAGPFLRVFPAAGGAGTADARPGTQLSPAGPLALGCGDWGSFSFLETGTGDAGPYPLPHPNYEKRKGPHGGFHPPGSEAQLGASPRVVRLKRPEGWERKLSLRESTIGDSCWQTTLAFSSPPSPRPATLVTPS